MASIKTFCPCSATASNEQDTHPAIPLHDLHRHGLQSAPWQQLRVPALLQEENLHRRSEQRQEKQCLEELQSGIWKREGSPPESGLNYPQTDYPVCCLTTQQVQKHLSCFHLIQLGTSIRKFYLYHTRQDCIYQSGSIQFQNRSPDLFHLSTILQFNLQYFV